MDLTVIITGLLLTALFVVPFIYISKSKNQDTSQQEKQLQQPDNHNIHPKASLAKGKKH